MADIDLSLLTPRDEDPNDKIVVMKEGAPDTMGLVPQDRFFRGFYFGMNEAMAGLTTH
jgi:hypothetical protein